MRLIDADKVIERINGTGYAEQTKSNLRFMVDMQSTIDAVERSEYEKMKDLAEQYKFERDVLEESQRNKVEVVRCKDCINWDKNGFCGITGRKEPESHYCSYGERKEE